MYRARDTRIGRDVAIKKLTEGYSGNADMLKRFYQEAGHTGNLHHPNIVTIYDFGDEDGQPYIVMQYLDGDPLDELIRSNAPIHICEKLNILEQVCAALAYAHSQGIIHRDVKPANIIVQKDGLAKLLDFGIARADDRMVDGGVTRTGTMVGTPEYMAPERFEAGTVIDGRSDIFSAGVVLYETLTGVRPFPAKYPDVVNQILHQPPIPLDQYLPSCPPQLKQVIEQALAKKPQDRYVSAGDMSADLNAINEQLKKERATELLAEANAAARKQDLPQAKLLIRQVLRFAPQSTAAKEMMQQVNQQISLQELHRRIGQLIVAAKDAIRARRWDQAESACSEGLQLDTGNVDLQALLSEVEVGKQKKAKIQQLLRAAEAERNRGNYSAASERAKEAHELEPSDSRILAVYKELEKESEEQRRKAKLQKLLEKTRGHLTAQRLAEAAGTLEQAEGLDPADPDLLLLKDEVSEAVRQEEKTQLVASLDEEITAAVTLEQTQSAMVQLTAALRSHPADAALMRLKLQLEPRLKELQFRRVIAEVSEACRRLPSYDALTKVREALAHFPGNSDLLKLESAILDRLARGQREKTLTDYLSRAHALLEDNLYLETVKILERCLQDGFSSPEIIALLNLAKSRAAERMSQELVERSFLDAKALLAEENYEAVIDLLTPVLARIEEPSLHPLLAEATERQKLVEKRIDQLVLEVGSLADLGLYDAAIGLIREEPPGVRKTKRLQSAFDVCSAMREREEERLKSIGAVYALLASPECTLAAQKLMSDRAPSPGIQEIEKRLEARVQLIADRHVAKAIDSARQALAADDAVLAESVIQTISGWQECCSPALQTEWKDIHTIVLTAKKVLHFRKVLRR